jgi:hypothetical protein
MKLLCLKHAAIAASSLWMFIFSINYDPVPKDSRLIYPDSIGQLDWAIANDYSCITQYNQYICRKG